MATRKAKPTAATLEFTRSLEAFENGKVVTSFIVQPYLTGVYVATNDGGQMCLPWKSFEKWVAKVKKMMELDGLTVFTSKSLVSNFHSEKDIMEYIMD